MEESVGHTVGRRMPAADAFRSAMTLQETMVRLQAASGRKGLVPKGVYRFRSYQEADTWMTQMLARPN